MTAMGTTRIYRPDPASVDEVQRCGRATFAVRHVSSTRTAVAVMGEIDAVNGRGLGRYVERQISVSTQLVLDLRTVDFFGTQGFTALYYISAHCTRSDVDWMIVGSPAMRRMLSIGDPDGVLPLVDELAAGLAQLDRRARCRHYAASAGLAATQSR
jgi:anti-anti-sigma factor